MQEFVEMAQDSTGAQLRMSSRVMRRIASVPGTTFRLVCVTNQFFNDNTRQMAELNDVELIDQHGLSTLLTQHRVLMSELERLLSNRT